MPNNSLQADVPDGPRPELKRWAAWRLSVKFLAVIAAIIVTTALALSALWNVPYIYTLIGFSAWAFFGHVVTADDDIEGGWSNPDGSRPFPWLELAVKAAVLIALIVVAYYFPMARALGT